MGFILHVGQIVWLSAKEIELCQDGEKTISVIIKKRQSLLGWKMDSICVWGTFHCRSHNEWHSSWYRIHQLICIHLHSSTPPMLSLSCFSILSFVYCIQGISTFFMLPLSGTSPFLINDFRTKDSAYSSVQSMRFGCVIELFYQPSVPTIKNTSYC